VEESECGEEVVHDPDIVYPIQAIQDFDENRIRHNGISCDSCRNPVIGPVYHRDPNLDYCQHCVQKGVLGAEFCLCYVVCCGYYGEDEVGVFSPWEDYYG
jgi:hypothetical protein